ncbi:MAG: hypothetical protein HRF40_07525 [Nitrososphaera sp.]|jgi:hypothetical protein
MAKAAYYAIIIGLASAFILMMGISVPLSVTPVQAENDTDVVGTGNQELFNEFLKVQPKALSDEELTKAQNIVLADDKVKQVINNRPYELMSQGFVGNMKTNPGDWKTQLNFNIGNETQLIVVVDLTENKILSVEREPIGDYLSNERSFALDGYSGMNTIKGLEMEAEAPSFSPNAAYSFTAFTLNAAETAATTANLCSPTHVSDSYWMQTGFDFDTTSPFAHLVWTDTGKSCLSQSISSSSVPYSSGHTYSFFIQANPTSHTWTVFVEKDTGESFTTSRSGMNQYTMLTSDDHTSVWFENSNTIQGSGTWDSQFSTDPNAMAFLQPSGSSNWFGWDFDYQTIADNCSSATHPNNVISGDLEFANTATWDLTTMADDWPAC